MIFMKIYQYKGQISDAFKIKYYKIMPFYYGAFVCLCIHFAIQMREKNI